MDVNIENSYLERAARLHAMHPVVDAHMDLAGEILLRRQLGEENILKNRYLEDFRKAGLNLVVSSVYVRNIVLQEGGTEAAWQDALSQIACLKEEIDHTEDFFLVTDKEDLRKVKEGGRIGILLSMEGLDGIGEDIGRIGVLYEQGVRGASLTWSRPNALGTGCCTAGQKQQMRGGLTRLGRETVRELERHSMFLDVSHLNDDGFEEVKRLAGRPFCASHSNARYVHDHYRNLTVGQMKYLADQGGVMGLNACKYIAGAGADDPLEMLCRHAEFETDILGEWYTGLGLDLCDSYDEALWRLTDPQELGCPPQKADCLDCHSDGIRLTAALLQRGMDEDTVVRILGGNFIRYFLKVLP